MANVRQDGDKARGQESTYLEYSIADCGFVGRPICGFNSIDKKYSNKMEASEVFE